MKKKLVLLAGVVAAAWGVRKLMQSRNEELIEFEPIGQQPERPQPPEDRLAA